MLESADEPLVVKLIDFGLSKVFTEGDKMRTACGTVYTMAPEVIIIIIILFVCYFCFFRNESEHSSSYGV